MAEVSVSVIGKDLLSGSLGAMQKNIADLAGSVNSLSQRAISPMTVAFGNLISDIMRNGVDAFLHLKSSIESIKFISLNRDMEVTTSAFATLLRSTEKANELLAELREYANRTPFEFTQLTAATKKMLAFGFSAQEITKDFRGIGASMIDVIGNTSSALGAGQEGIERITRALGQMQSLGRISAEDMNQLTDIGVAGYKILAEQMGISIATLRDKMKKGQLDSNESVRLLMKGLKEQFGGGMEALSKTAEGMSSTLNDYISDLQRAFGSSTFANYKKMMDELTYMISSPNVKKFVNLVGNEFGALVGQFTDKVIELARSVRIWLDGLAETESGMQDFYDGIKAKYAPAFDLIRGFITVLKNSIAYVRSFVDAFMGLWDVKDAITFIVDKFREFTSAVTAFGSAIGSSGTDMESFAQRVVDAIKPMAFALVEVPGLFKAFGNVISVFITQIFKLRTTATVIDSAADVYNNLAAIIRNVTTSVNNFATQLPTYFAKTKALFIRVVEDMRPFMRFFKDLITALNVKMPSGSQLAETINKVALFIEKMVQAIGASLPYLNQIREFFSKVRSVIENTVMKFSLVGEIIKVIGEVSKRAVINLAPFVRFIQEMFSALLTGMGISTQPGKVITGIAIAIEQLAKAVGNALPRYGSMLNFFSSIHSILKTVWPLVGTVFNSLVSVVRSLGSAAMEVLPPTIPVIQAVVVALRDGINAILKNAGGLNPMISKIGTIIKGVIDLFVKLAPSMSKIFNAVLDVVVKLVATIQQHMPEIAPIIDNIVTLIKSVVMSIIDMLPSLLPVIDRVVKLAMKLFDTLSGSSSGIKSAIGNVVNVVLDLVERLITALPQIMPVVGQILTAIGRVAMKIIDLMPQLTPIINMAVELILAFANTLIKILPQAMPTITRFGALLIRMFRDIGAIAGPILIPVLNILVEAFDVLEGALMGVAQAFAPLVQKAIPVASNLLAAIGRIVVNVGTAFAGLLSKALPVINKLIPSAEKLFNVVVRVMSGIGSAIVEAVNHMAPSLTQLVNWFDKITLQAAPFLESAKKYASAAFDIVSNFVSENAGKALTFLGNLISGIAQFVSVVATAFKTGDYSAISTWFTGFWQVIKNSVANLFSTVFSPENMVNTRVRITNALLKMLQTAIQGVADSIPNIATWFSKFITLLEKVFTGEGTVQFETSGVLSAINNLFTAIWTEMTNRLPNLVTVMESLPEKIGAAWEINSPKMSAAISRFWNQKLIPAIGQLWKWLEANGGKAMKMAADAIINWIGSPSFDNVVASVLQGLSNALGAIARSLVHLLPTLLFDLLPALMSALDVLMQRLMTWVSTALNSTVGGLLAGILDNMGLKEWGTSVVSYFDGVNKRLNEGADKNIWKINAQSDAWRHYRRVIETTTLSNEEFRKVEQQMFTDMDNINKGMYVFYDVAPKAFTAPTAQLNKWDTGLNNLDSGLGDVNGSVKDFGRDAKGAFQEAYSGATGTGTAVRAIGTNAASGFGAFMTQAGYAITKAQTFREKVGVMGTDTTTALGKVAGSFDTNDLFSKLTGIYTELGRYGTAAAFAWGDKFKAYFLDPLTAKQIETAIMWSLSSATANIKLDTNFNMNLRSIGYFIAKGIADAITSNQNSIATAIKNSLGVSKILGDIASLTTRMTNAERSITAIQMGRSRSAGYGGDNGGNVDNSKNVTLYVTINQSTPTAVTDNIRYAQALALAKIF